jgi:hypothetical protein
MLHIAVNTREKRVENILFGGREPIEELVDLYNRHTTGPKIATFATLEEARARTIAAIESRYFPESKTVEEMGPVQRARLLFEEMRGHSRKEILDACERLGIKRATASTQYQKWRSAQGTVVK